MEKEIYVVVAERDTFEPQPDNRPIVFEQYADKASLADAMAHQKRLGNRYGHTRIARLVFVEPDQALRAALQQIHDQPNCRHEVEAQLGNEIWQALEVGNEQSC